MSFDVLGIIWNYISVFLDILFFRPINQIIVYLTSALYLPMPNFGSSSDVFIGILVLLVAFYIIYQLSKLLIMSSVIGAFLTLLVVFLNSHFNFGLSFDYVALLRIFFVGFFGFIFYKIIIFLRAVYQQVDKPVIYICKIIKTRLTEDLKALSQKYKATTNGKKEEIVCMTNTEIEEYCRQMCGEKKEKLKKETQQAKELTNQEKTKSIISKKDKKTNKFQDLGVRQIDE